MLHRNHFAAVLLTFTFAIAALSVYEDSAVGIRAAVAGDTQQQTERKRQPLLLRKAKVGGKLAIHPGPSQTVFENGKDGYKIFRIPAIIRAANGDLLAFCEARAGGDASEIDLVLKRSSDRGASWGPLEVVQESDDFRKYVTPADGKSPPITVGNPAPVVDTMAPDHPGRIHLPFTLENDLVFVTHSDDHGKSWSPPRNITSSVKDKRWGWYATGPVHAIQLQRGKHRGRLVVPADHRLGDKGADRGPNGAQVIYSDDHGQTWRLGAIDATYDDGLNANETTVVELADGRLYFNTRDQHGEAKGTRGEAFSDDGGESFAATGDSKFAKFVPSPAVLDPPVVQAALLRVGKAILFSGPDASGPSGKGRSDLRIRYSLDEARTWQDGPVLHVGPAAYSDMVIVNGKQVGVLYEAGAAGGKRYHRIDFQVITVQQ